MSKLLIKVGITGGIGAGKSIVCEFFRILGVPVYPADERAKQLMQSDHVAKQIKAAFGDSAFDASGKLNRSYLSDKVFNNEQQLKRLNSIVHPAVEKDFRVWVEATADKPYVLKEAALLVETGSFRRLDYLITVTASEKTRIERIRKRDPQRSVAEIKAIISRQLAEKEKIKHADFVVKNDEDCMLIPKLLDIHDYFIKLSDAG